MSFKSCPNCHNTSYSAADDSIWICPCCGEDLSLIPSGPRPCTLTRLRPPTPVAAVVPDGVGQTVSVGRPVSIPGRSAPRLFLVGQESIHR